MSTEMDPDSLRLVHRLINAWDGDLMELVKLVELVGRVRKRGIAFERERCARLAENVMDIQASDGDAAGALVAQGIAIIIRQQV